MRMYLKTGVVEWRMVLALFPLLLYGLLAGLLFRPPIPYTGAGFGATLAPLHLHQEHRHSQLRSDGLSGTALIYSFQPWGGVVIEKSDRLISYPDNLGATRFAVEPPQSTAGQRASSEESNSQPKKFSIRPSVQFLSLQNPNWMITS